MSVDATAPISASTPPPPEFPTLLGHPRPLWMLFMTEFWERFAFYGIRWALTLYIVAEFYQALVSARRRPTGSTAPIWRWSTPRHCLGASSQID